MQLFQVVSKSITQNPEISKTLANFQVSIVMSCSTLQQDVYSSNSVD